MPDRLVIAYTSPLFYLHLVGQLDLLRSLYGRIAVPPAVGAVLRAGIQAKIPAPDLAHYAPWIQVMPVQSQAVVPAIVDLGPGEAQVIALGLEHPGALVILDDLLARRIAAIKLLGEIVPTYRPDGGGSRSNAGGASGMVNMAKATAPCLANRPMILLQTDG